MRRRTLPLLWLLMTLSLAALASPAKRTAPKPVPPACAAIPAVKPDELAATWPKRLGQKVRLRARIERAVDLTQSVVRAGRQRFVVMLGPSDSWSGEAERVFTVMGSATAWIAGGPQVVAQLLLEPEGCPSP